MPDDRNAAAERGSAELAQNPFKKLFPAFISLPKTIWANFVKRIKNMGAFYKRTLPWQLRGLVVILVLYTGFGVYTSLLLNREREAILQKGEPLTFAETTPPDLPRRENAALLYLRAGEMSDFTHPEYSRLPNGLKPLTKPNSAAKAVLEKYAYAVALTRQAAFMEKCQFKIDRTDPLLTKFPHLQVMRRLARLMVAQALIEAQSGDSQGALRDIEVVFRMTYQLRDEPMLVGVLSGLAMEKMANLALFRVLETAPVTLAQARAFQASVPLVDWPAMLKRTLINERTVGIRAFERLRQHDSLLVSAFEDRSVVILIGSPLQLVWQPWMMLDEVYDLRLCRIGMDAVPESMSVPLKVTRENDEAYAESIPAYALISQRVKLAVPRARFQLYTSETWGKLRTVALALAAYRTERGAYPLKLKQVTALSKSSLWVDPFSGREFVYRSDGKNFALYSVGRNLRDDGGAGNDLRHRVSPKGDDIGWGLLAVNE